MTATLRVGLATMLTAFVVFVGLVVQTAQPAAALAVPPIVKTGLEKGATVVGKGNVVKGVSLAGRTSNPLGLALTAGQLAWWAYSERDTISDFVADPDKLRDHLEDNLPPPVYRTTGSDQYQSASIDTVSGRSVTMTYRCVRGADSSGYPTCLASKTYGVTFAADDSYFTSTDLKPRIFCKSASGVVTPRPPSGLSNAIRGTHVETSSMTVTKTATQCSSGETVVGVRIPVSSNATYSGSAVNRFPLGWGTFPESGGFILPSGDAGFKEVEVTARCKNSKTGETQTLTSRQTYTDGEVVMISCKQHLGDDWYGTGTTIAPEKPTVDDEPIPDEWDVPDYPPLEWDELIPDKEDADWQPCYGTKKGCTLDVWIDDQPCTVGTGVCEKWTKVLERNPDRVKCVLGSREVAMKYCRPALSRAYEKDTETKNDQDTEAPPTGDTETTTGTETGTTTGPGTGPTPTPEEAQQKAECFPSGWGLLNPFEWVYKPVKCVFTWAFKPKTELGVRLDRMKAKLENRAPFSWVASFSSLPTAVSGGGCPTDWGVTIKGEHYSLICGTPVEGVVRGFRPVMLVLTMGAAAYPFIRGLVYASTPLVKPTPT
jgi:hypothetical protein